MLTSRGREREGGGEREEIREEQHLKEFNFFFYTTDK